jgi:undecaprenyl-diphosphatase
MDTVQTSVLGFVQGLTELLPVSSSGHLILLSNIAFSQDISTLLLTSLHLGTTLAIVFAYRDFFFKELFSLGKLRTLFYIALATIPAALLGVMFESAIEERLHSNLVVVIMLILVGIVMIWVENSRKFNKAKITKWEDIRWWQALLIGLGQSLALIPGTSRSGASTITGVLLGIDKFKAIEYSFLLGAPVLLGSFFYSIYSTPDSVSFILSTPVLVGMLISAITGYISIEVLRRFSRSKFLTFFGVYRILLGILILLTLV